MLRGEMVNFVSVYVSEEENCSSKIADGRK